ncbi:NHLP leader peptide family RiPP precursor [Pontibacter sp. G13]|uniref:NHLP leader peptide family RiPP precursor n=1 Tax=Pontibacter sp. G13 TaxID=3074898 RepID=UPI002889728F|nr:NHLP leader peptide family RiPP precursor [Pontibacter sp. G13]WNJ16384.1 NHLP leader peptide family RiPP precursor [Pontibacter sp. G13]
MDNSQLISQIIKRSWEDDSFKNALMANPEATIQETFGASLETKPGTTLKVSDQTNPDHVYLNLPPKPNYDEMELTDEQLELVAGGEFVVSAVVISGIVTATATATLTYTIGKDAK